MKNVILFISLFSVFSFGLQLQPVNKKILEQECLELQKADSCLKVGKLLVIDQNIISSYLYLDQGCKLNNYQACSLMGNLLLRSKNEMQRTSGIKYLVKACKEGKVKKACQIIEKIQKTTPIDLQKDCDAGDAEACLGATQIYFKQGEKGIKKALEALTKACSLGNKKGCETKKVLIQQVNKNISHMEGKEEYLKSLGVWDYFK